MYDVPGIFPPGYVTVRVNRYLPPTCIREVNGEIHCGSLRHLARVVYKMNARRARPKRRRLIFGPPPPCGWVAWNRRLQLYHPHARRRR